MKKYSNLGIEIQSHYPQSVAAYYGYGLAAEKFGKQDLAQDCFTTVVKLKSKLGLDEVILVKPPKVETTSLLAADDNPPKENSYEI